MFLRFILHTFCNQCCLHVYYEWNQVSHEISKYVSLFNSGSRESHESYERDRAFMCELCKEGPFETAREVAKHETIKHDPPAETFPCCWCRYKYIYLVVHFSSNIISYAIDYWFYASRNRFAEKDQDKFSSSFGSQTFISLL